MEAAQSLAPEERMPRSLDSERKCIVTGELLPKDELIRFALAPDTTVVPDLAQNLPGRGLWVKADYSVIETAVRKNLFTKAAKASVKVDKDLADLVVTLLHKRCLSFLGLARSAGIAVLGQPQVEIAIRKTELALLLIAPDATQSLDSRHRIPEYRVFSRTELGAALGYDQIVYAGLKSHGLTEKLKAELARLEKIARKSHISHVNG